MNLNESKCGKYCLTLYKIVSQMSSKNVHLYRDHYRIFDIWKQIFFQNTYFVFLFKNLIHLKKIPPQYSVSYEIKLLLLQRTQTSLGRLQDVLKRSQRLTTKPDVVRSSGKRRLIYDVLKTSDLRHLKGIYFMASSRRLIYVILGTFDLRCLEDVFLRCLEDVQFTTS